MRRSLRHPIIALRVWLAGHWGIGNRRREDVHGRRFPDVYRRFGHEAMLHEALHGDSWRVTR